MKKYEITDIQHSRIPALRRIRALRQVADDVPPGTLGGFVQCEENLAQDEGGAWIYGDAICREGATIQENATLADNACAEGWALVTSNSQLSGAACVRDNAIVIAGIVSGHATICGNACVRTSSQTGKAPEIGQKATVMGTVAGNVSLYHQAFILPGQSVENPIEATLYISEAGAVLAHSTSKSKKLTVPER